jgi:glycogen debranching enzyme
MTVISLILGYFFIVDNGSWFKPFGRDVAIIFISVIYILGQLIIRWISKALSTDK